MNFSIKNIYNIYSKFKNFERTKLTTLSILVFMSILLELISIGLIIPFIKIFIDESFLISIINKSEYFKFILNYEKTTILILIIVLFTSIFILKFFCLTIISYKKFYFINELIKSRTLSLYKVYLNQDIFFHNDNHSSSLVKNLINEMFCLSAFYNALIIFLAEVLFTVLIFVFLLFFDPLITVVTLIISFFTVLIFQALIKNRVFIWGNERQEIQAEMMKEITEALSAIKELIIFKKINYFRKRLKILYDKKFKVDVKFSTYNDIPKNFIELIGLFIFCVLITIMFYRGDEKETIFLNLAVLAAVTFKVLPSISRIMNAVQQIQFHYPVFNLLHRQLKINIKDNLSFESSDFIKKIEIRALSFKYPNTKKYIFKDLSFTINKGELIGIHGESGTGKSTLIYLISGFINKFSGKILCDNYNILNSIECWRSKIGYLAQSFHVLDDTLLNNILLNDKMDKKKLNHVINISQLDQVIEKLDNGLDSFIGEKGSLLSGGEIQRVGLARALYRSPEILILDEPTSSLDGSTSKKFIEAILLLRKKITVIMITHDLSLIKRFDKKIKL